jgi:hypothetical protein
MLRSPFGAMELGGVLRNGGVDESVMPFHEEFAMENRWVLVGSP